MLNTLLEPYTLPARFTPRRTKGMFMLEPGTSRSFFETDVPGCVRQIYVTTNSKNLRDTILRFWWDGEEQPSVECPLADFFGIGHDLTSSPLNTSLFYNAPNYGYNCYIPMPYGKSARMEVINQGAAPHIFFYSVEFQSYDVALEVPWRFHACWRRVYPAYRRGAGLDLLEAKGAGRLIGCIYHILKRDSDDRMSHGGADQLFIDGDTAKPNYIYGGGGEDYAHHAWGYSPAQGPYAGAHYVHPVPMVKRAEGPFAFEPHAFEQHDGGHYSIYRYYIPDPTTFESSLRFTFGTCANEISSTVYWYQTEPHQPFCSLPPTDNRHFGQRVTAESTLQPISIPPEYPVAVLGPLLEREDQPWKPDQPVQTETVYETNLRQAYANIVRAPYEIRWRVSQLRGGFLDLASFHKAKGAVRARGIWHDRTLPHGTTSYQLLRFHSTKRKAILRIGFEDEARVWHGGKLLQEFNIPEPQAWDLRDIPLELEDGANEIVIGFTQQRMGQFTAWGVYCALLDETGDFLQDVEFDKFEGMEPTLERWVENWPPDGIVESDNYRDPLAIT